MVLLCGLYVHVLLSQGRLLLLLLHVCELTHETMLAVSIRSAQVVHPCAILRQLLSSLAWCATVVPAQQRHGVVCLTCGEASAVVDIVQLSKIFVWGGWVGGLARPAGPARSCGWNDFFCVIV